MRNMLKKLMGTVLIFALLLGVLTAPSPDAQAASQNSMKKLELRWDLKKGKKVVCDGVFPVVGKKDNAITFKITKYKVKNAGKKGYKKLTLTCVNTLQYKPTKEEIHKILQSSFYKKTGIFGGNGDSAVVDYNTGISLKKKNKFDVKVKCSEWELVKSRIYKDNDGCYMDMGDVKQTITITYPEDYDGLCIGFLADNQLAKSKADKMFWKGKKAFAKTSYYKKGKKNSHWMRVRASKEKKPDVPAAAEPVETPDIPTGIRTMVYDGTNSEEIQKMQEPFTVIVKDGVTSIEDCAFHSCNSLTDIVIPNSVTNIGYLAFYECSSLKNITIPDSVTSIGTSAFQGCSSLTGISIPAGLTSIEEDMFMECSSLTGIMIPKGVTSIGSTIFMDCSNLTSITWKGAIYTSEDDFEDALRDL